MKALLPDADGADVAGAVAKYHAFGNRRGTFGALEAAHESCFNCSDRITRSLQSYVVFSIISNADDSNYELVCAPLIRVPRAYTTKAAAL